YFGSALSDIYEIVMKKCAAWHESHTVYDKKGELIKCDPYEHPFILTNEILVDCVRACRFWHYDEKTIEFLTKWNEKALKMQLAVYESNRCVGNGSPYNIYEVSDQAENMGIFKITRLLKHTTKEAMRDPLRECCIG
ncbi:MAG: hypothetical protein U9Q92_06205, partial [archaeon]|nr:hypothetical protein [archaeon]